MTQPRARGTLVLAGLFLLAACVALRVWSGSLTSLDVAGIGRTVSLVALLSAMGLLSLCVAYLIPVVRPSADQMPHLLVTCLVIGALMRLFQWGAAPVYEKDYLRYLWDGAVLSSGVDPYSNTPASVGSSRLLCDLRRGPAPDAGDADACVLSDLADASRGLVDQVSYRYVTTIYPPVTQMAFAAANRIRPFSLEAWRAILLCAEMLGLIALIGLLRAVGEDPLWSLVYWWNPVVIVHVANGAHVEALLVPFLLAALWAMTRQRAMIAAVALSIAAAIKLWPLLLLPSLLSASKDATLNRRAVVLGFTLAGLLLWPQLRHFESDSGLTVFATQWVRNAFVFPWLVNAWEVLVPQSAHADRAARLTVLVVVLLLSLRNAIAGPADARIWAQRWGTCIAALFLLAPTGCPWYFIGVIPLLCFWRVIPMLLLPATLPIYFALYIVEPLDGGPALSSLLVAAEFLPVWAGLGWIAWRRTGAQTMIAKA